MSVFDRQYYIVDHAGNYYSINEYDALTVAKDETVAQWFDILEANKRINNSGMSKNLRTVAIDKNSLRKKSYMMETFGASEEEFSMDEIDLAQLSRKLSFVQTNIKQYQKKLKEQQMAVEEEICDILHFIELYQYDDGKALELVELVQNCRKRRRKIKDAYFRAETFSRIFSNGNMGTALKDIIKQMNHMEIRDYVPRRLPYLFVQAEKQSAMSEEPCEEYGTERDEKEEMNEERQETVFDGRKNDWESMVAGQLEFFENVQQYRVNLQLDAKELNRQIEELLLQCEDANCNVTQGYQMFKQLKVLRLALREKLEELNKVSLIADCFDCEGMADTYRYCVDTMTGEKDAVEEGEIQEAV